MNRPLNTKQNKFVRNYAIHGLSIAESVRKAGYNFKSGRSEDYGSYGCKLLKQERVQKEVSKLREKSFAKDVLSVAEKRSFLARAVRCDVRSPDSDLIQEISESESEGKVSKKVRVVDKLKAVELDSKIAGDFYSDRESQVSNPFLFIVSLSKQVSQPMLDQRVIDAELVSDNEI